MPAEKEPLTFLQFPPGPTHPNPVTVIEVGPSTHACPKGLCKSIDLVYLVYEVYIQFYCIVIFSLSFTVIVHMTCKQNKSAKDDLQEIASFLLMQDDVNPNDYEISTDSQSTQTSGQVCNLKKYRCITAGKNTLGV